MSIVAVVGAQWGDEGKGKLTEYLSEDAALVVNYAGGYNPGQSMMADGERLVFHLVPAASLHRGKACLLGQGMAIDPALLRSELSILKTYRDSLGELWICQRAQVILPHHIELDQRRAEAEGASGVRRRGVGPALGDRVTRRGIRIGDLQDEETLERQIGLSVAAALPELEELGAPPPVVDEVVAACLLHGKALESLMTDGAAMIARFDAEGRQVILEGAFGTMVDMHQGSYPHVVGTSVGAGGACTGTGISPRALSRVIGVAKAYTTRSGSGPLPTQLTGALAERLQQIGGEVNPTTGHPRRCGMFDGPALRYAARVNGFDTIALTKLDVLSHFDEVPFCVSYELDGKAQDEPPFEGHDRIKPVMEMLPGWKKPIGDCRRFEDLPTEAQHYVERVEEVAGVRISHISVGKDRAQVIERGEG